MSIKVLINAVNRASLTIHVTGETTDVYKSARGFRVSLWLADIHKMYQLRSSSEKDLILYKSMSAGDWKICLLLTQTIVSWASISMSRVKVSKDADKLEVQSCLDVLNLYSYTHLRHPAALKRSSWSCTSRTKQDTLNNPQDEYSTY